VLPYKCIRFEGEGVSSAYCVCSLNALYGKSIYLVHKCTHKCFDMLNSWSECRSKTPSIVIKVQRRTRIFGDSPKQI